MQNMLRVFFICLLALTCTACWPYFEHQRFAVLKSSKTLHVVRHDRYLDLTCYVLFGSLPSVFELSKPSYRVRLEYDRRWLHLFLVAYGQDGTRLELTGPNIRPIGEYPFGDVSVERLESNATADAPTHFASLRSSFGFMSDNSSTIELRILDGDQVSLGQETLQFRTKKVSCMGFDTL
jgi:hypothetical protein